MRGDVYESCFVVSESMQPSFLTHLHALNSNIINIESGTRKVEELFEGTNEALNKL